MFFEILYLIIYYNNSFCTKTLSHFVWMRKVHFSSEPSIPINHAMRREGFVAKIHGVAYETRALGLSQRNGNGAIAGYSSIWNELHQLVDVFVKVVHKTAQM